MTDSEVNKIANRVVEIMNGEAKPLDTCVMAGPPKQSINEKQIEEVVNRCQAEIIQNLHSDEEQFVAVNRLRDQMSRYWEEQYLTSRDVVKVNEDRTNVLGKFIEMTIPR